MKIGIHMLTAYPPSNPNRDELGSPKTAIVGGKLRQRISSQALKRAWRLSDQMQKLDAKFSKRTRQVGQKAMERMVANDMDEKAAEEAARSILGAFGKEEKKKPLQTSEVVILGQEEWDAIMALADSCASEGRQPTEEEISALPRDTVSVDVAMFGRMRAAQPKFNKDASISVSHALTANQVAIEADFWTAVDDLNLHEEDAGAGGMGEREYGSGVYYVYAVVDLDSLAGNLGGNSELACEATRELIKTMATVTPGGHRTSFAHQAMASYLRVEAGETICGNLMLPAFEKPVSTTSGAIESIREAAAAFSSAYGLDGNVAELSIPDKQGSLAEVVAVVKPA